jgi:hypothetical protein
VEHCGGIQRETVVAEIDEGDGCSGFFIKSKVFDVDIVDEGQVHRREGRQGYHLLGGIWGVYIALSLQGSHSCGVCCVEFLDQVWTISISCGFPAIMGGRIAFPSKEILQFAVVFCASGAKNLFYFIFRLVIYQF